MVLRCYVLLAVLHNEIKNETKRMFAVEIIIIGTSRCDTARLLLIKPISFESRIKSLVSLNVSLCKDT